MARIWDSVERPHAEVWDKIPEFAMRRCFQQRTAVLFLFGTRVALSCSPQRQPRLLGIADTVWF
jgi:hypothetical protein